MLRHFTRIERFFSLFTTLRAGEGLVAVQLCLQAFAIMCAYYMLKVIREPMILAEGSAELKAYSTALQALLLMVIVPIFAMMYHRSPGQTEKHHLFRNTLLFFLSNLLLFALGQAYGLPVAIAFYVWLGIFSVMVVALFWAFAADLFNLRSGQRIFPLIAAAVALGALLGSGMAHQIDQAVGHAGVMLFAFALLCIPCWFCARSDGLIPPESRCVIENDGQARPRHPFIHGFTIVWQSQTLRLMAVLVILLNLINTNGEYILASFVTDYTDDLSGAEADDYIGQFYSRYFFFITLLSFLLQLFVVSRIYDRIGIAGALYILPVLMMINYSLIALFPVLAVARIALMLENSVNYSIGTTTRHALFLPVPRDEKYIGKNTIDTFFYRLGDVLSGSFVFLASGVAMFGLTEFVLVNAMLASLLLLVSIALGRRHRGDAAAALANQPPVATNALDDLSIPSGQLSQLQIAADTFYDPDLGDALRYLALLEGDKRLPPWIKFDGLNRRFDFHPPAESIGSLRIRIIARDFEGLQAEVSFILNYGSP